MMSLAEFCFFMAIFLSIGTIRRDLKRMRDKVDRLAETPSSDTDPSRSSP